MAHLRNISSFGRKYATGWRRIKSDMHRLWMTIVDWMCTLDVCVSQVNEIDVRI